MKNNYSTLLLVALLVTVPLVIFSVLHQQDDKQRAEASKISTNIPLDRSTPVTPSFFPIQPCPTCTSDTIAPMGGGTTPSVSEVSPEAVSAAPGVSQAPCDSAVATDNAHHKKHKKHQGKISSSMNDLLKMLLELINKIIKMLGGSSISMPESGSDVPSISGAPSGEPQTSEQPDQPQEQNPCQGTNGQGGSAAPTTSTTETSPAAAASGTVPSAAATVPSGAVPSGAAAGTGATTDATCTGSGKTPVAPVTGYTLSKCEDFNNGVGTFSPYDGGGEGTVVGGGRKSAQCTATGGVLVLTQLADGSTCGGSMDSFSTTYGYTEVRMKTSSTGSGGSAPHPVLIQWPDSGPGEFDFFETDIGESGSQVFLHCIANTSDNCYNTKLDVDYTQWHVYGFEWTASGFTGYIDGKQVYTTDGAGSNAAKPFHQTIQLDNLSGKTPVSPGKMEVDYVHLYKKG